MVLNNYLAVEPNLSGLVFFDLAGNNVPQNQKSVVNGESGNYNFNSNSEQLSVKPGRSTVFASFEPQSPIPSISNYLL